MRVLVLGGTGHLGSAIVRALLERHFEVIATGRRDAPPANLAGLPVHYMQGDADIAHLYLEVKELIESQILDTPFLRIRTAPLCSPLLRSHLAIKTLLASWGSLQRWFQLNPILRAQSASQK